MGGLRGVLAALVVALLPGNVLLLLIMTGQVRAPAPNPNKAAKSEAREEPHAAEEATTAALEEDAAAETEERMPLGREVVVSTSPATKLAAAAEVTPHPQAGHAGLDSVSALYEAMPADAAAAALQALPSEEAARILSRMEERKAGRVLAEMSAKQVARLTTLIRQGAPQ